MDDWLVGSAKRLTAVAGSDPGVYVLALHAFVEGYLRRQHPECAAAGEETGFGELVRAFGEKLKAEKEAFIAGYGVLGDLAREHAATNRVRHRFAALCEEEAVAATRNFTGFCKLVGIEHPELTALAARLDIWKEHASGLEGLTELRRLEHGLNLLQRENRDLAERLTGYAKLEADHKALLAEQKAIEAKLADAARTAAGRKERVKQLADEKTVLLVRQRELEKEREKYATLEEYIEYMSRFTAYTRTRVEFERELVQLAPEQEQAVAAIKPGCDYLVRGAAGTGKSLVLLEALRRTGQALGNELGLDEPGGVLLLTYTKTLAKYDAWLSGLMRVDAPEKLVVTLDHFFYERLGEVLPGIRPDYGILQRLIEEVRAVPFLSAKELLTEVEEFIFANAVTRAEYVEEMVPRKGLGTPLTKEQRARVWEVVEKVRQKMDGYGGLSKNYMRVRILERQQADPEHDWKRWAYLYIDEVQDESAAGLRVIRNCAARGVVMAGDLGQSLYGLGSPYARAGIDIKGRSRVLHTNFRNTRQIQELAARVSGAAERGAVAFREGPLPELYTAAHGGELRRQLAEKADFFIHRLGYDPGNVAVLVPTGKTVKGISEDLQARGLDCVEIKGEDFDFSDRERIRICTLHSSKGLDFPVVLLYLPVLWVPEGAEESRREEQERNLVYVAMTRAMDSLNVFLQVAEGGQKNPVLQAVEEAFRELCP